MSIPHITFTRFLAALAIFIYHFAIHSENKIAPFNYYLVKKVLENGDLAVPYFFILSGFIMAIAYYNGKPEKINLKKFYISRFSRIYPIYFVSLFLYIVAIFTSHNSATIRPLIWVSNFLLTQSWFPNSTINFAAWSLSVEVFFYFLFPFLYSVLTKLSSRTLVAIALFIVLYCFGKSLFYETYLLIPTPIVYVPIFALGMISGILYKEINHSHYLDSVRQVLSQYAIYFIIVLLFLLILSIYRLGYTSTNDGIPIVIFTLLVPLLSWDKSFFSKIFSKQIFVLLGNVSYGLYILQFPLKFWFDFILFKYSSAGYKMSQTGYFYLFFVFCLFTSTLFFYIIEEPSRRKIKQVFLSRSDGNLT